ncbi:coagulation factor VII-like [Channa argus]|uniref:coagulation factor VII-like n=1 Tax=Channa argus TaxID=215402 RepID=UPI00351FC1E5
MASYKVMSVVTLQTLLTPDGECPWMESLQKDGRRVCGGTLVDVDSVLSSVDCFSSSPTRCDWTLPPTLSKYNYLDNEGTFGVSLSCWPCLCF